ncbi:transposase, partial [Pedobacter miscanthi]
LDTEKIVVRVTKIELKTGEIEILVSSLFDMNDICTENMKALYDLRWPVEEGFKKLKPKMKLEQFGCRKPEGIFQEFEAHIFMINLVALLGIQAQREIDRNKKRKLKYKYNWQNAF